jgi:hypothetical protein
MLTQITYFQIFGKPLIMYLGIITFFTFLFTAMIPVLRAKKVWNIQIGYHIKLAWTSIILAGIHGILGMAIYFRW